MARDIYLVPIVFVMGLSLVLVGLYALVTFTGIPMPGPEFIVLVTVVPGLYLVYLGVRTLMKIRRGVDPLY